MLYIRKIMGERNRELDRERGSERGRGSSTSFSFSAVENGRVRVEKAEALVCKRQDQALEP